MVSLSEQLQILSNPEPNRFDLDEDDFDLTRAQVIDKAGQDEDVENHFEPKKSSLRKNTVPLLQEEDKKYAGQRVSRAQLAAERDGGFDPGSEGDSELESDYEDGSLADGNIPRNIVNESHNSGEEFVFHSRTKGKSSETKMGKRNRASAKRDNKRDPSLSEDDVIDGSSDEKCSDSNEQEEEADENNYGDDDGASSDDDDDVDDDDDDFEGDDMDEDDTIQNFSAVDLKKDIEKGKAAKNQIGLWDSFLEIRIRLQKVLMLANKLPQKDDFPPFKSSRDKNFNATYKQGKEGVVSLLENLLLIQEKLLEQNPDTKKILYPAANSNSDASHGSDNDDDDEEIPSDTEEENSDKEDKAKKEEPVNDEDSLKLPAKRKHNLTTAEFNECISKRHVGFKGFRDSTISKWSEKTRLSSGRLNSKSFSSFDRSALAQINHILSDKDRLIKRSQLKRSSYKVLGKREEKKEQDTQHREQQTDLHLKDYDPEIFDDDDFYHQLLREFIDQRTGGNSDNPIEMGRQWLQLQNLRRKIKKQVDRKASKGRKLRYDVHAKLVSFMAPVEKGTLPDSSRNELFSSLFGSRQQEEPCDVNLFR